MKSAIRSLQSAIDTTRARKIVAVIAAGGTGARVGAAVPKQFVELAGKPILLRTLEGIVLLQDLSEVVITLPARHVATAKRLLGRQRWKIPVKFVRGGSTRQQSVVRGVARARKDADLILVHDAVRPLCDPGTMRRVVEAAWQMGGAVPALPATETIQRISPAGRILATPPREQLYAIQTPQCFRADILRSSLERAGKAGFQGTDESSVVRWAGHPVFAVAGTPDNIKITRPLDLKVAEFLLSKEDAPDRNLTMMRVGQGIDYHCFAPGRKLILGGVEIPFEKGLEGYSDADALSHALCDALLGAAGLGDIGRHYPDHEPANRNRSSLEFLSEIGQRLEAQGWTIRNLDATLLAQRPRLAPFIEAMRRNIARSLGIGIDQVNIKATTTEGMNAEGREEGISAQAVALIEKL